MFLQHKALKPELYVLFPPCFVSLYLLTLSVPSCCHSIACFMFLSVWLLQRRAELMSVDVDSSPSFLDVTVFDKWQHSIRSISRSDWLFDYLLFIRSDFNQQAGGLSFSHVKLQFLTKKRLYWPGFVSGGFQRKQTTGGKLRPYGRRCRRRTSFPERGPYVCWQIF